MVTRRLVTDASNALAVLAFHYPEWIDRDQLIEESDIKLPDEEIDTRIIAVGAIIRHLGSNGYAIEQRRGGTGIFYRLVQQPN